MTQSQCRLFFSAPKAPMDRIFERLDAAFEEDGYALSTLETDEENEIFEFSLYLPADEALIKEVSTRMNGEIAALGLAAEIEHEELPDIDWVTKSLEGLPPVRAGRFVVHGHHDRHRIRQTDLGIEIEAGRAFGTGHHGTTAGCLEMIEYVTGRRRPDTTLDLGTGSAVLAIGIAKLTKSPVLATDIDAVAIDVARRNVRLNRTHSFITCVTATGFDHRTFAEHGPFDLIVANILPRPLMAMAKDISHHLAPGGDVILSGILTTQRRRVLSAFNLQGLVHRRTITKGEWVTLHLDRGPAADHLR